MSATLQVLTDTWSMREFTDRDGTTWRVVGQCDTARCGAVCCKVADWTGVVGTQCEHLQDDLRCRPHAQRGMACKPLSCALWPLRQGDVDCVNALAKRFGFSQRCHLELVEV
jgi:hypothetical protein